MPTVQEYVTLLTSWEEEIVTENTHPMPIEAQANFIAKKYPIETLTVTDMIYNSNTSQAEPHEVEKTLICFKNVVCKYRPHIHLGDYWLNLKIVDGSPRYVFYTKVETDPGVIEIYHAVHPHLSGGIPCLGSHEGELYSALTNLNYIQFLSTMRNYLTSYNGRSTYVKGSAFKKIPVKCQLHSESEIRDIFAAEEGDMSNMDIRGIGKDPMRWNWPKNMTAYHEFIVQGQEARLIFKYFVKSGFPYLEGMSTFRYNLDDYQSGFANKIFGYIAIAMEIGELNMWQALEFTRIFLISLNEQYNGSMSPEKLEELTRLSTKIYACGRGMLAVNTRYSVSLPQTEHKEIISMIDVLKPYENRTTQGYDSFLQNLKWAGSKISNFIILLRKRAPEKAKAATYLHATLETIDTESLRSRYNKVKKVAYNIALQQLEKDKRRFIREINRPEISNIVTDDGQGTLFSQNL